MRRRSVSRRVSPGPRVPIPRHRVESAKPLPTSPGNKVAELSEFDLKMSFARAGTPGEDVEDQLGAVDNAAIEGFFKIALLRTADSGSTTTRSMSSAFTPQLQFFKLARSDEGR